MLIRRLCCRVDDDLYDAIMRRVGGGMRVSDIVRIALMMYVYRDVRGQKDSAARCAAR